MRRITKIVIASALTVGIVGGVAAHGKYRGGDPSMRAAKMVTRIADKLDLNETQTASLKALSDEIMTARKAMKSEMGSDIKNFRAMITAETFDQAKALDMINAKTTAVQNNAPQVVTALGVFLDGLTAEQKAEIAEHMGKHHRRGHGHRKHGDDDRDDG